MTTPPAAEQRTCLYSEHVALGARMAPFAGFLMPIQYTGILDEHQACRTGAVVFDTCHMGEFRVRGPDALDDLERLVSCRVGTLAPGRCRYGFLCNPDGGVIDDLLVYRMGADDFMLVVNAGTRTRDAAWIAGHLSSRTRFTDDSEALAKLDIQGPKAPRLVAGLLARDLSALRYYGFLTTTWADAPAVVSRTGYTGEIGFELYVPVALAGRLWRECLARGATPAGLGARDTLRLEMGMPLYGHELDEHRNAGATGIAQAIDRDKPFIGSDRVWRPDEAPERLVALRLAGRRAARHGAAVHAGGRPVGVVTSGSFAPSVGVAVALACVSREAADIGTPLTLAAERGALTATVVRAPFFDRATAREPIANFLFDQS
jgi:aminomethyltransferase